MPQTPLIDANGQPIFETQLQAISEAAAGNGVANAGDLAVSAGSGDLDLDVAAGDAIRDGATVSLGPATLTTSAGDASEDRWDIVVADAGAGSLAVREGTPAQYPSPPALGSDDVLLAVVFVEASATQITDADILSWRLPASADLDHDHTGALSAIPNAGLANSALDVLSGTGLTNGGTVSLGGSTTLDIAAGGVGRPELDPVSLGGLGLPNHHIQYAGGLADEEITRFRLPAGEALEVYGLDLEAKGGGSDTSLELDIYDADAGAVLASTTAGTRASGSPLGTSGSGATILVRLSTGSSGPYTLAASGQLNIT